VDDAPPSTPHMVLDVGVRAEMTPPRPVESGNPLAWAGSAMFNCG